MWGEKLTKIEQNSRVGAQSRMAEGDANVGSPIADNEGWFAQIGLFGVAI